MSSVGCSGATSRTARTRSRSRWRAAVVGSSNFERARNRASQIRARTRDGLVRWSVGWHAHPAGRFGNTPDRARVEEPTRRRSVAQARRCSLLLSLSLSLSHTHTPHPTRVRHAPRHATAPQRWVAGADPVAEAVLACLGARPSDAVWDTEPRAAQRAVLECLAAHADGGARGALPHDPNDPSVSATSSASAAVAVRLVAFKKQLMLYSINGYREGAQPVASTARFRTGGGSGCTLVAPQVSRRAVGAPLRGMGERLLLPNYKASGRAGRAGRWRVLPRAEARCQDGVGKALAGGGSVGSEGPTAAAAFSRWRRLGFCRGDLCRAGGGWVGCSRRRPTGAWGSYLTRGSSQTAPCRIASSSSTSRHGRRVIFLASSRAAPALERSHRLLTPSREENRR